MHQFLTVLFLFNILLISSIQANPAFKSLSDRLYYMDLCESVDENDMRTLNGECLYGLNEYDSGKCGKTICYQGPNDSCNEVVKCNPSLQCVKESGRCTGCVTWKDKNSRVEICSNARKNNDGK